ncbi:MAG: DUF1440 domain-containing protein [Chloroflexi bacterium]|nr:DUF1440 domain-containing protein [Chloroflexota bacterium]
MVSTTSERTAVNVDSVLAGVTAGLVGGAVFGVLMTTMDMMPMIAGMIGSASPLVGFVLHMVISTFIGATYGLFANRLPSTWAVALGAGTAYGIFWWVLGALVLMPLILGMGEMVFVVQDMQIMSLIGHISFGLVMGAFYKLAAEN